MQPNKPLDTVKETAHSQIARGEVVLYGVAAAFAVILPLIMVRLNVPFIRLMDDVYHPIAPFQLFVFTASVMMIGVLGWKLWGCNGATVRAEVPLILGILVSFHFLALMRHHSARSWDYACYERAAQAIVAGQNPYGDCYIYFPTPAQTLAAVEQLGAWGAATFGVSGLTEPAALWDLVFYFYESTQLLLVMLAFFLCYRLATMLGIQRIQASILVAALFLINNPLLATLTHNQVNLWVLDLVLIAILWLPRHPILSGLCVALGGHVKLYPLVLLLPWTLKRQWTALISAGIGLASIFLIQTGGGRDLHLWTQFLSFADSFPRGTFFRDNSLHSLVYNSLSHLKWLLRDDGYPVNERYVSGIVLVGMAVLGIIYLVRFVQRERLQNVTVPNQPELDRPEIERKLLGHTFDAIALALIASPVVWEHHYLLAMPLVIGAVARVQSERQLWLIGVGAFGIFAMPTFDVFPFSYHRLAGLLLLMYTLSPAMITNWGIDQLFAQQNNTPNPGTLDAVAPGTGTLGTSTLDRQAVAQVAPKVMMERTS